MRRIALTGLGGVALLLAALFSLRLLEEPPPSRAPAPGTSPAPIAQAPAPPAPLPPAAAPAVPVAPAAAPVPAPAVSPAAAPAAAPIPPRFDVVRVGARGSAVIAGRAAPGAEVVLLVDGQREAGRTRADGRGEWVILPADPLPPGAWELSLRARLGGQETLGPDAVIVVVPQAGPATVTAAAAPGAPAPAAGAPPAEPAAEPAAPLAVLIPEAGTAAAPRLLQGPQAAPDPPRPGTRAAPARLGMSSVDYEEGGSIRFAGTAPPGASVRVYVGDLHAGDAVADTEGRWLLLPDRQPPVGRSTLRVDQVGDRGRVAARVEVPFQRDELPPDAFDRNRVVVQPGANLWRIARAVYGRGTRFTVIYDANRDQIRDPRRIFPVRSSRCRGPGDALGLEAIEVGVEFQREAHQRRDQGRGVGRDGDRPRRLDPHAVVGHQPRAPTLRQVARQVLERGEGPPAVGARLGGGGNPRGIGRDAKPVGRDLRPAGPPAPCEGERRRPVRPAGFEGAVRPHGEGTEGDCFHDAPRVVRNR